MQAFIASKAEFKIETISITDFIMSAKIQLHDNNENSCETFFHDQMQPAFMITISCGNFFL